MESEVAGLGSEVHRGRKVGFLCIGAQKGGTTWLNEQLLRHPQVYLPPIKEVHYFNFLHSPLSRQWIPSHYQRPVRNRIGRLLENRADTDWRTIAYYARVMAVLQAGQVGEDWYQEIYALCDDENLLKGDITPDYLVMSMSGIQEVHTYNPDMRLIVMLREPVSRAVSTARMMLKRKNVTRASDEMWRSVIKGNGVLEKSRYAGQLQNWLQVFPREQLLIVSYERLAVEPKAVMDEVCDFLAIDHLADEGLLAERVHAGKDYKVPRWVLDQLESSLSSERLAAEQMFPFLSQWWSDAG